MGRRDRLVAALAGVIACALVAAAANADDKYPSKPVRIIVSFSAGGPTDTVARVMGAKLGDLLGQQFVVENRVGAGGNIGADQVAKSPPDGYTLLMATVSTHAINPGLYKNMPYDPVRDFAPVAQIGVTPTLLGLHPSLPATDLKSLVALVKDNPGKFTYGSSGLGSILHLCGEQFKALADDVGFGGGPDFDGVRRHAHRAAAGRIGGDPRDRRGNGDAHARDAGAADLAGARIEGFRVLYLERDPRPGRHPATDPRSAQ